MSKYQVFARKYRPQRFCEVIGQDPIVTTLKNSIKQKRLAHAYLFSGSHGTGKTTLARVFAKALNCKEPDAMLEPCGICSSCKEIACGNSMDVLEIDGASHRGIDDIRTINETVSYSTSSGKYKIYIIDEVHMLTKEAFNALLKTLEEPPENVKFFFATTEAHKVPATILSRCQRYTLNRIPHDKIVKKLRDISNEMEGDIDEESLHLIATRAQGGLRDAESLLDQILSCHTGKITASSTAALLGLMSQEVFFELDRAAKEENFAKAFEIADAIYNEGKNIAHFVEMLTTHYRNLLLAKLSGKNSPFLTVSEEMQQKLEESEKLYRKDQLLHIIEYLVDKQQQIRFCPSPKVMLEAILLKILQSQHRIPADFLIKKLTEIEQGQKVIEAPRVVAPLVEPMRAPTPASTPAPAPAVIEKKQEPPAKTVNAEPASKPTATIEDKQEQQKIETVMQFAAVELEGTLQKRS
jgi:DNA polymerase-3 subunit gamma/tau